MPEAPDTESPAEIRYKVGEVCRLADVQPYVLRYWESEFPALAAERGVPGPRTYSARELRVVQRVKQLLYDEGFTIAGAKKRLDAELAAGTLFAADAAPVPPPLPAPPPVPVPPPLPPTTAGSSGEATKARRSRSKGTAPTQPALDEGVIFEEVSPGSEVEPAAPPVSERTEPAIRTIPEPPRPDPRIGQAVAELKEILAVLSREP